ncbi:beta-ketoacyl-[acyl-carrier-protein] synthase II [Candidatus Atribacteria bacterium HGW-Atribacteria-1]|nr:MAG: beta-ketoacyl-[acyl-carrier-protein] synthase II [Candidatus Atribacteria bacterium HGW-Atribacteria-1]
MKNRVVITGLGPVTPVGIGKNKFWQSLIQGKCGIDRISYFDTEKYPTKIAAEVKDFNYTNYISIKEANKMDKSTQFSIVAAMLALEDSKLKITEKDSYSTGVIIGSGIGGIGTFEKQHKILLEKGPGRVSPFFVPMMISNISAGEIAIKIGAKGPNGVITTACASSAHALGIAFKLLQQGDAQIIISGGTEAAITPMALAGFCKMRALSTQNDHPKNASKPFDKERDGFIMGEGAGILILETLQHAKERNANIYAEIFGFGMTADAYHITAPEPEGEAAAKAMEIALKDAKIKPSRVNYINAHGTSTPLNDKLETLAVKRVFGEHAYDLKISSNKSMTGHLLGASGGVEVISTTLTIKNDIIPPTINYNSPDPECDLDYVPNKSEKKIVDYAISNSFGFGGHNGVIVLGKYRE